MSGRTMRAVRFHGPGEALRIEQVPYPEAGPGDVVVRIAACGICGSDVHIVEGMGVPGPVPITLGHEPAGVVEAVGAGVREWKPGDRVAVHIGSGCGRCRMCRSGHSSCCSTLTVPGLHIDGAFAEAVRVPETCLVAVPDGVSMAAAAVATDCVATPYHALACRGSLQRGDRVAVIGIGGLGSLALRLARVFGAEQVVAVDVSTAALARAEHWGATATILSEAGVDPATRIREITEGGADLVLECVGLPETVASGANALRPGGRLVVVGVGMQPPRVDVPQAFFALFEMSVLGAFGSHADDLRAVLRLEAERQIGIESSISHRLALDEVPGGLEMLRTKEGNPQRILVDLGV